MADQIQELLPFLSLDARVDLKSATLQYVLGLTGSDEGKELIKSNPSLLKSLFDLLMDKTPIITSDAYLCVLNLSTTEELGGQMLDLNVIPRLLDLLLDPNCAHADKVCMILSNLTRTEKGAESFLTTLQKPQELSGASQVDHSLYQLVDIFDCKGYNKHANFNYLATVFLNLSQVSLARQLFLDHKLCLVPRLLPYTQFADSTIRRGGVVGLLRNLCFEVGSHQWLLSEEVDLLPALLLPLAGPEQFDEDEMDCLPDDLQYLPDDKQRDDDPDIRKMCVEAIMKLCSTKLSREFIKSKKTYLILREYHKWEKDQEASETCEKLIHMLIADEPQEGMENLHEVELPENYTPSDQTKLADSSLAVRET